MADQAGAVFVDSAVTAVGTPRARAAAIHASFAPVSYLVGTRLTALLDAAIARAVGVVGAGLAGATSRAVLSSAIHIGFIAVDLAVLAGDAHVGETGALEAVSVLKATEACVATGADITAAIDARFCAVPYAIGTRDTGPIETDAAGAIVVVVAALPVGAGGTGSSTVDSCFVIVGCTVAAGIGQGIGRPRAWGAAVESSVFLGGRCWAQDDGQTGDLAGDKPSLFDCFLDNLSLLQALHGDRYLFVIVAGR
jgi:hypothetical protein